MKRIGAGLQYAVYDIGNGRVLKKPISKLRRMITLLMWKKPHMYNKWATAEVTRSSLGYIQQNIRNIDMKLIGNPNVHDDYLYEQDKSVPIKNIFDGMPVQEKMKIIDGYVDNILKTWTNGFCNMVFNFTNDYGVDADGDIILLDIGELTVDKSVVLKMIEEKAWLKDYSYGIMDERMKAYFRNQMEKHVTTENLDRLWKRN